MVVRISLALKRVRSQAANPAQSAPAAVPASSTQASAQRLCQSSNWIATALPARAPTSNWPSAPMFHTRAW